MNSIVLVKLGGSLITDKRRDAHARHDVIERLAAEIADARRSMDEGLIVGHGSGSFGHVAAANHDFGRGPIDAAGRVGASVTQDSAARLHRLLVAALVGAGVEASSWAASSAMTASAGEPVTAFLEPLTSALEIGLVPVTYGDVVADRKWGAAICSTETIFRFVVDELRRRGFTVSRMLWMGETDGVYDRQGRTVPRVDSDNFRDVLELVGDPAGTDVTGGMILRLETTRALARLGIESWILDGTVPGRLAAGLAGEEVPGTRFAAD